MRRLTVKEDNFLMAVETAVAVLAGGGLVLYPTETVYGVAVDATNPTAVSKLLKYKNRPAGKAISVLVADPAAAEKLVELNPTARSLYATFLPGPLTVVSKSRHRVDRRLESELGTLGIRISSHPLAGALAKAYAKPLSATSANASGKARPYTIEQILTGLTERQRDLIDLVLDVGRLPRREPSTVTDTTQSVQEIVRAGDLFASLAPSRITASERETRQYAAGLVRSFSHRLTEQPLLFALEGELGAGKTQFAKGVAEGLGVKEVVTSPTFVLSKEYRGAEGVKLLHLDCWRLETVNLEELGLEEEFRPGTVLVIEWPAPLLSSLERIKSAYKLHLQLNQLDVNRREIKIQEL